MSGKQVIFYEISDGFLAVITKLSEKLYESGEKVLIFMPDAAIIKELDTKLWTYSKLSFIPHGSRLSTALDRADMCAIWLSTQIEFLNKPTALIHNGSNGVSDAMRAFATIIDIFDSGQALLQANSKRYKEMGFVDQKLWIQDGKSWKAGTLS